MNHTIKYTKTITDEQIDDIMSSAIQGMAYWADSVEPTEERVDARFVSEVLIKGGTLKIRDGETAKDHELTLETFLKGLSLDHNFNIDDYDMYEAERIVQLALFGEVVYS